MVDIKALMFDKSLSQRELAEIMNTSQSEVSQIANAKRRMLRKHIDGLIDYFGEETISQYMVSEKSQDCCVNDSNAMEATLATDDDVQFSKDDNNIPVLPGEIINRRNLDIYKYIQNNGSELISIDPRSLVEGAEFAMEILKDSMSPDIVQGDIVFLKFLPKTAKLHSGAMYFIDTPAYAGVIRDVYIDGDAMTLRARNPKYGDIVLDMEKDNITAANIIGIFRKNFTSSYSQMEAVRQKKDEQIDQFLASNSKLIEEIQRRGDHVDRLIDKIMDKV
jgi:SOS-response transcriptional repressor LexA